MLNGEITLSPWQARQLNPNSYNFRLGDRLSHVGDPGGLLPAPQAMLLPDAGVVLEPGNLYLGVTEELIGSSRFAMTLLGRSSIGRLGLFLNATADLGHVGTCSRWTLELSVVQPLRVYRGMNIGQVAFWEQLGEAVSYDGRYQGDRIPMPCRDRRLLEEAA